MLRQNNKQNKNTNPIISRQGYHLTQPCPSEEKQTNKNSAQTLHYTKLTQTTGPGLESRNQKEEIIQPSSRKEFNLPWCLGQGDLKHNNLKKKIKKRQRNTAQIKEQTRNTEVQINEKEIGKLPEKQFRIMMIKMIKKKNLKKWRKCKNQLTET